MKTFITRLFILFFCTAEFALAQSAKTAALAPGAQSQLASLLETPAMIKPAAAEPLGKNWFRLETDAHIFTSEVSVKQVASVLLDIANQDKIYNGQKSKLTAKTAGRSGAATLVDFVSISVAGPFQIKTPYRASVTTLSNTDSVITIEVKQLDSDANTDIKNLYATRYAEEVTIGGKKYTYIRIYTIDEVNASILPGAKGVLEKNSLPINAETLELIIKAAKTRPR